MEKGEGMNPEAIPQKTEKGLQEIETRQHKLSGRLRAVLFMIDGQRSVAQLLEQAGSLADQLEGQLTELANQGFISAEVAVEEDEQVIEPVTRPAPAPAAQEALKPVSPPAPVAPPPAAMPAKPAAAPRPAVPLDVLKARLTKMVNDTLGMRAVFHAPQIAAIKTHAELEATIDEMSKSLATSMGATAATRWRSDARSTVGLSA